MGGTIDHFTVGLSTFPTDVYLDTSFIIRCYFARFTPRGISTTEQRKNVDCNNFLNRLSRARISTSLFAIEEGLHKTYFTTHIKRAAEQRSLANNWKRFRQDYPAEFRAARILGIQEMLRFVGFLNSIRIRLVGATSFFQRERYLPLVKRYALLVMQKYEVVEAMDAFHIAIMRANRIDWLVTAEENLGSGFEEVAILTL